ncbi:MAG: serine--tRNA ligase [Chlamydiota bacterium]
MLDIKLIRKDTGMVKAALARRGGDTSAIDELLLLDSTRRRCCAEAEALKNRKNVVSKEVGKAKSTGGDASAAIAEMKQVSDRIMKYDIEVGEIDKKIEAMMICIPNIPCNSIPDGVSSEYNVIVKQIGEPRKFDFKPLPHWEIGERLGILDFASGATLSGSNFALYKGLGARLERALYSFMLDLHVRDHGYFEVSPPYLVKRECMLGTGQLPKLEGDMYLCEQDDLFLVPTAEVPLVNLHREQLLDERLLPLNYVAYSPCFRREAGSYGKDTRGLIRVHQFDKVEMVKFTRPEDSYAALDEMLLHSEAVLKALGLPYRVLELCAGEISFASAKTYDIEVWAGGVGAWLEVASISTCEDFQARRAGIRCRLKEGKGTFFPHTLNGSGVALARTFLAILENYQNADGTVAVPKVLVPYMGGAEVIG